MNNSSIKNLSAALETDTRTLCQPEGRMVGTEGHRNAERFVSQRLSETGLVPYRGYSFALPYHELDEDFTNFVGVVPGRDRTLAPLLIGAHYDSAIPAPCADDNGAAVAICLALGDLATRNGGFERDLIIAIFDAEEPPHFQMPSMGSNRFGEDQLDERGVHFAMIYDLVGHDVSIPIPLGRDFPVPSLKELVFVTGAESHPDLPDLIAGCPLPQRLKLIATLNEYVGDMSDHGVFRKNGVPYLFLSCGRWQHYHRPTDTPDRLNYRKMARLTQLSFELLERMDGAPLDPFIECEDPVDFEAETFRRSTGILLPLLCRWAGVSNLGNRESVDRVVAKLMSLGL